MPGADGLHAVRVGVTTADGTDADWFQLHLLIDDKPRRFDLAIAHNDPPGTWSINAVDLYTDETVSEPIFIEHH